MGQSPHFTIVTADNFRGDLVHQFHVRRTFDPDHRFRPCEQGQPAGIGGAGDERAQTRFVLCHRAAQRAENGGEFGRGNVRTQQQLHRQIGADIGRQRCRQPGMQLQLRLQRTDPAHQVNELLDGAFAPGSITFDITGEGDDATRVTATLRSERGGLTRIAAPLLQRALARALAQSLDEDREDLESGSYTGH